MSNRSSSKQHCLVGNDRPTNSQARKRNKAENRARQDQRQAAIKEALATVPR